MKFCRPLCLFSNFLNYRVSCPLIFCGEPLLCLRDFNIFYLGKNEERAVNACETWRWRIMLKIKWTDRITNGEVFQKVKEERLLLKFLKNRCHSWIGHTIRHNELVVNILEGAISGKKAVGRLRLQYLKQVARNTGADSYPAMKRMAYNKSIWKAANQLKDWGISRRISFTRIPIKIKVSWFSVARIANCHGLNGLGIESGWGGEIFPTGPDRP